MAPHQVTVTIHKPADLFIDSPDENPMQPEWEADSGMERIFNHLKTRRLARGVRVVGRKPSPAAPAAAPDAPAAEPPKGN